MSFDNWRKRLEIAAKFSTVAERREAIAALKINFSQPGEADCGYYRKPITEKHPSGNGRNVIIGWVPVSYFMHGDKLVGLIGAGDDCRDMTDDEVGDEQLWSWVVANPISYETYRDVVENGGDWPDMRAADGNSFRYHASGLPPGGDAITAEREITRDDNKPPELLPEVEHREAIDNAIGAGRDLKATTADEAARLAGAANILRDRRLAAEKVAKAKVDPLHAAYVAERDKWAPMVKRAKEVEDSWRRMVTLFEVAERKRVAAAQLAALEEQQRQEEAAARAADRAIAAGEPEQPPVVEEMVIPKAPEPIKPTYGNYKPRAKPVLKFATIYDFKAVLAYFAHNEEVAELLQKLATNAVRAGETVPGATIREGTE